MCRLADQITITITRKIQVDCCMAKEILFLNDQGVRTIAHCCGHDIPERGNPHIIIFSADRLSAIGLGYEPKPVESIGITPDDRSLVILSKSQGGKK